MFLFQKQALHCTCLGKHEQHNEMYYLAYNKLSRMHTYYINIKGTTYIASIAIQLSIPVILDIIFHPFSCVPHTICGKIHNVTICFRFLISGYKGGFVVLSMLFQHQDNLQRALLYFLN